MPDKERYLGIPVGVLGVGLNSSPRNKVGYFETPTMGRPWPKTGRSAMEEDEKKNGIEYISQGHDITNIAFEQLALLLCISEVPGSTLQPFSSLNVSKFSHLLQKHRNV